MCDVLVGGYPCQGFSIGGSRQLDHPGNSMYLHYLRALATMMPAVFVAENVKGLLSMSGGDVVSQMVSNYRECGYVVSYATLNAVHYGVPQDRERVFIVGLREDLGGSYGFPSPTHGRLYGSKPIVTMHDAIWDLRFSPGAYCDKPFSSRYMSRQRKRGWREASFTIPATDRHVPMHPSGETMVKVGPNKWNFAGEVNRRLSAMECAAIQGFPAEYAFFGDLEDIYRQVGNAVPPPIARSIAKKTRNYLECGFYE